MTLRRGDEGPEVEELQERLHELGYDAPGRFGPVTYRAVERFQEDRGLLPDGIVGPVTRAALADARPVEPIEPGPGAGPPIDRTLRLSSGQYIEAVHPKDLLVLHHTAGASARSTFDWWQGNASRVATAYLIARDGTIHELFDPRFWAYHLGIAGTGGRVDRRSIGIEIASEGWLEERPDGLYAFGRRFGGEVYDHGSAWRGYRRWAAYTAEQVESAIALVDHLCTLFGIDRRTPEDHLAFDPALADFRGICGHHHLRQDKSDLHPGFPWHELVGRARLQLA